MAMFTMIIRVVVAGVLVLLNLYVDDLVAYTKTGIVGGSMNLVQNVSNTATPPTSIAQRGGPADRAEPGPTDRAGSERSSARVILTKTHGCLMSLAWLGVTSVSLILARYYRRGTFVNVVGGGLWTAIFKVHTLMMYVSASIMLVGVVVLLPWVASSASAASPDFVHVMCGVFVVVGVAIMVVMGTYAPKSSSPWRPLFKVTHRVYGKLIHLVAAFTMVTGYCSPHTAPSASVPGSRVVLMWYTVMFCLEIVLDLYTLRRDRLQEMSKKSDQTDDSSSPRWPTHVFFTYVACMVVFSLSACVIILTN